MCDVAKPTLRVLTDDQIKKIYESAYEVLSRTGMKIPNKEILSRLKDVGCKIEGELVKIPAKVIDQCINDAPKQVKLYNRDGEPAMSIGDDNVYFGAGADSVNIHDSFTGERRPFVRDDVEKMAVLQDYLENMSYVMCLGTVTDVVDSSLADVVQFEAMVTHTKKPILFSTFSQRSLQDIYDMACLIAGGEKAFAEKPFACNFGGGGPKSPLSFDPEKLNRTVMLLKKGIPYTAASVAGAGGTGPVTLAGHLVLCLAEMLGVTVIAQKMNPGHPLIAATYPVTMDMKTTTFSYASPEFQLNNCAKTELFKYINLPIMGTGGCSDSKAIDIQAGVESFASCFLETLSGTNLVHDVGFMEGGVAASMDLITMGNEFLTFAKRYCRGISLGIEHLAVDLIDQVGPDGNFIQTPHTFKYFKDELWMSEFFNKEMYNNWKKNGGKTFEQQINKKVKHILATHSPEPLSGDLLQRIKEIMNRRMELGV